MNRVIDSRTTPSPKIEDFALRMALNKPRLENLNIGQLEKLGQIMTTKRLTDELNTAVSIAGIDYDEEKALFLDTISPNNSRHTKISYTAGIKKLESYVSSAGLKLLALTPAQADEYIYSLRQEGRAASSVRLDVSNASSFFNFIKT